MLTLEKAILLDTAFERLTKALRDEVRIRNANNKLLEENYRIMRPVIDKWMRYTNAQIIKALNKKYINKSFQKSKIVTDLTDWDKFRKDGLTMVKPTTLEIFEKGGNQSYKIAGIEGAFDIVNIDAVNKVNKICSELIVEVNKNTKKAISALVKTGIADGQSMGKIAKQIRPLVGLTERQSLAATHYREKLVKKFPKYTDAKLDKMSKRYSDKLHRNRADMIARTETARAQNEGTLQGYKRMGYKKVRWSANVNACSRCMALSGHTFTLEEASGMMPLHPDCYDSETEVYSDEGWKLFKDLKKENLILSLNPKTFGLEWLPYINKIEYPYKGKMFYLHNKWFDLMVTPNHNQFFGRRIDGRNDRKKKKWEIRKLQEVMKYAEFCIPRTANWKGKNPRYINIDSHKIKAELFCKFMGIWLSEGSITKRSDNWYQISIAQNPEGLNIIYDEIKDLPIKLSKGKDHITCNNMTLGKYLMQFGHSHQKYIPKEIKELSKELIKIFLDMYVFGDGHRRITYWNEKNLVSDETVFYTSSSKMAGDIGELILKAGGYPSYSLKKTKGMAQKFRNGTYIINHDMHVINWNKTKNAHFGNGKNNLIEKIDYDGMVYDVELPRNHILWVKRDGKTCWSGNCRCAWISAREGIKPRKPRIPSFAPAKTTKEAEKYIKENLNLESVNYEGLNLDTVNDINKTLVELKRKYPKINLGKINYTNIGDPETMGVLRHTPYIPKNENISKGILYINKEYFGKYKKLEDVNTMILSSYHDGFFVSKNLSELISHEMGHALTYTGLKANNINEIITYQNSIKAKKVLTNISRYAEYNFSESLAEAFVKYNKGDKLSQTALKALRKYLGVK